MMMMMMMIYWWWWTKTDPVPLLPLYQQLLGLNRDTDLEDCVSLVDGHKVLKTLQSINSLMDDGPKDEIVTQIWAFAPQGAQLSEDFVQGTQDFSDASFTRAVNFSQTQEAQELVNGFVEKTSEGKVKDLFKDLSPSANLLFMSSFVFKGLSLFFKGLLSFRQLSSDLQTVSTEDKPSSVCDRMRATYGIW